MAGEAEQPTFDDAKVEELKNNNVEKNLTTGTLILRATPEAQETFEHRLRKARVETEEILVQSAREELNRLKQQRSQRKAFFGWAIGAISAVLIVSVVFMSIYFGVKGINIEPAVMIAWLSSGLVETLGLGYIIANYLFAGNGKKSAPKS